MKTRSSRPTDAIKCLVGYAACLILPSCILLSSCKKDNGTPEIPATEVSGLQEITVSLPDEGISRTSYIENGDRIRMSWEATDYIYLIPKNATDASDANVYKYVYDDTPGFIVGKFKLAPEENGKGLPEGEFYAFYGVEDFSFDNGLLYTLKATDGLTQESGKDYSYLSTANAMKTESYCDGTETDGIGFNTIMAMLTLDLNAPVKIDNVRLSSMGGSDIIVSQTYRADGSVVEGSAVKAESIELNQGEESGTTVVARFLLPPQNLTNTHLQICINDIYKSDPISGLDFTNGNNYYKLETIDDAFQGDGSENNPWIITTPQELKALSDMGEAQTHSKHIALGSDIDMSGIDFNPIETYDIVLDGKGHTISNLTIDKTGEKTPAGLFGEISNSTIKNLTLENFVIRSAARSGCLAGSMIKMVEVSGITIKGTNEVTVSTVGGIESYDVEAGGMAGYANSYIIVKDITVEPGTTVTSVGDFYNERYMAGGVIGYFVGGNFSGNISSGAAVNGCGAGGISGSVNIGTGNRLYDEGTVFTNSGDITGYEAGGLFSRYYLGDNENPTCTFNNSGNVTGEIVAGGYIGRGIIELSTFISGTCTGNVIATTETSEVVSVGWKFGSIEGSFEETQEANKGYTGTPVVEGNSNGGNVYVNGFLKNGAHTGGYDKVEWK